jgi:hypothetical protein
MSRSPFSASFARRVGHLGGLGSREEIAERLFPKCKLRYLRGPGESYSDVILKLVELEAKGEL